MWSMNPSDSSPRELAAERLRVRAGRLRAIRRRVWATALATFAIAFGVIGVSGSMGTQATTVAQNTNTSSDTSTGTGTSSTSSSGTTSSDGTSSSSSSSSDQGSSSAGSPMTTQQS
jgi:uncharacterized membrane protein YgcG